MMQKPVMIIAEAGVNHNGDIDIAKRMIVEASRAGADAIKFQSFSANKIASRYAEKAKYQKQTTGEDQSQLEMLKKLQLAKSDHIILKEHCERNNILFLSTPFDAGSLDMLIALGMPVIKVSSGEITNLPMLIQIASCRKPVILSTGMSTLDEVRDAVELLINNGTTDLTVLQCNTEYPSPFEDVNLKAMHTMARELSVPVGYSDHTKGIEAAIAAVAFGACVIEKHFTLDNTMQGPDHRASIEPQQLCEMVRCIRNIEKALGDGVKRPTNSEMGNKLIARKSIIAAKAIKKGDMLTEENLTTKRPGTGISPMQWDSVVGTVAARDFYEDELIEL